MVQTAPSCLLPKEFLRGETTPRAEQGTEPSRGGKEVKRANTSGATWLRVLPRVRQAQGLGAKRATRWRTRPPVSRATTFEGNPGDTIHPWPEQGGGRDS